MFLLDNLKPHKLYKKQLFPPFIKDNKRKGTAILLLSPNYETSLSLMNNPFIVDKLKLYQSYYIERDILYTINGETNVLEMAHPEYDDKGVVLESGEIFIENTGVDFDISHDEFEITELYCRLGDKVIFFNENYDMDIYTEATEDKNINSKYKRLLFNDRLRNNKSVLNLYDRVKADNPWIVKTYYDYNRYKQFNLFIDLYYYNQAYLNNNTYPMLKSIDMYYEYFQRLIKDKRIERAGYKNKVIFLPIYGWTLEEGSSVKDYTKNLNPISVLYRKIKFDQYRVSKDLKGLHFVIFGRNGYFKFEPENIPNNFTSRFKTLLTKLETNAVITDDDDEPEQNSSDAIAVDVIGDIEKATDTKLDSTGEVSDTKEKKKSTRGTSSARDEELKAKLIEKIMSASRNARDKDEVYTRLDEDEDVKRIINDLQNDSETGLQISATRASRITSAQDKFMSQEFKGKSIKDMITNANKPVELPETSLPIETINDEWHHLKSINFEKAYDIDADILKCLHMLSDKSRITYPVSILKIDKQDTSTTEDSVYTFTVNCEGYNGKRFSLKFDIPKLRDNRFMRLRGNEKIFSIEMPLLPISKTAANDAQIVTFYNKIFVERYNTSTGKSNPYSARFLRALSKYTGKNITIAKGDNRRICTKYDLPIDYIDLATVLNKITYHSKTLDGKVTIYFNQDEIRKIPGVNAKNGIPIAISSKGKVAYYNEKVNMTLADFIASLIDDKEFVKIYTSKSSEIKKSTYTRAKLLGTYIPIIVILAHDIGLSAALDMAKISYDISSKRDIDKYDSCIPLKDGFINYKDTYESMLLMNGLLDCDLDSIAISDINKKSTWIAQLESFGGRQKSDGLDTFKDMMMDPISIEVCKDYKLPTTYHAALIYASNLLADNKFIRHTDLRSNRYRTNEIIVAQFYRCLAAAYRDYSNSAKRNRNVPMSMKQSAVIDMIMQQNNTSDLSVFQPLLEIETKNNISTKGASGLNSDRAYTLEKRGYDPSMINILCQSTSFAGNVGVNRTTTIDPNITGNRGYFKQSSIDEGSVTKSMGMTEALTPFMLSSDDPFRNDMTFIQTSKHSTPVTNSMPLLVTTGADTAMPYLSSDMFAFKAKKNGKIKEITKDYMLIDYDDKTTDYVNLSEQTMKNSDGGFYITLQLMTDKKVNAKVKAGEVVAWDKMSFSKKIGLSQLAYNNGTICKLAVLTTDDGYEDSGVCSEWLSDAMSSDIVLMKSVVLLPQTDILSIVKVGQAITEGDPILVYQDAFEDEDATLLIKNLSIEDNDVTFVGRTVVRSKVTGVISDIKIYRTCELSSMSSSLKAIVNNKESQIKKIKTIMGNPVTEARVEAEGKQNPIGKLKNCDNHVLIEIYMKFHDKLSVGDKVSEAQANKNVIRNVYTEADSPYTDFRPEDKIDMISSCSAIDGRIITSPIKQGALNKLMIELQRKCAEIYGKKAMTIHEIYDYFNNK